MDSRVHQKPAEPVRMPKMTAPALPGYYSEQEEAARLGLALSSLRRWRRQKIGPASVRIGRRTLYRYDADEKWLAEEQATAERKKGSYGLTPPRRGRPRKNAAR
jgi:hypothetical protein